ncbi:hypothetical protein KCP70_23665 [Salmonella enterica subsp. enterica]|nr:hypothetical protein KCP70_23665 [Salmonella enterica subsp. enterica]
MAHNARSPTTKTRHGRKKVSYSSLLQRCCAIRTYCVGAQKYSRTRIIFQLWLVRASSTALGADARAMRCATLAELTAVSIAHKAVTALLG